MVAIVGGNALGLSTSSLGVLGSGGQVGAAGVGRSGEEIYLNAATGNLVLRRQDELLIGRGPDIGAQRTYNSQGGFDGDNDDNWRIGFYRSISTLVGGTGVNTAGSTVVRTEADGALRKYSYDTVLRKYVSTEGSGSHDTLTYSTSTTRWTWTDGDSRVTETYDWNAGAGKLLSTQDVDGNAITYAYQDNRLIRVERVVDELGRKEQTLLTWGGNNLAKIETVQADGSKSTRVYYRYDASNRLERVIVDFSPADNLAPESAPISTGPTYVTTYTYDGTSKRVASITQTDGSRLEFSYKQANGVWRVEEVRDVRDPADVNKTLKTTLSYDTVNNITTVTDALNQTTRLRYDSVTGQLLGVTGPAVGGVSQQVSYGYDAQGNLTSFTDARQQVTVYEYDANGNRLLERDVLGNTVKRKYGSNNQLLNETRYTSPDPDGPGPEGPAGAMTTRYTYDTKGHLRFVTSAEGRVTEYVYHDTAGNLGLLRSKIEYTKSQYDLSGFSSLDTFGLTRMEDWVRTADKTRAERCDYSYDFRGQLASKTEYALLNADGTGKAEGATTTNYMYGPSGELLQVIDPRGVATAAVGDYRTTYTYDSLGRLLTVADAAGALTTYIYDDAGRRTSVRLDNGHTTTTTYDRGGQAISVAQSNGLATLGATNFTYDKLDRLRMSVDPTGVRNFQLYDEAGRLVGTVNGDAALVEYVYNAGNQLIKTIAYSGRVKAATLTTAIANPTAFTLAAAKAGVTLDSTNDRMSRNVYDKAGRLAKTVDGVGAVVEYLYDGVGRHVKTKRYGTPLSSTKLTALETLSRTRELLPEDVTQTVKSSVDRTSRSLYDKEGLLRGSLDAEGYLTEYKYDAAGRQIETIRYNNPTPSDERVSGTIEDLIPALDAKDQHTYTIYNAKGQVEGQVDAEGNLTELRYDGAGNINYKARYYTPVTYTAGARVEDLPRPNHDENQITQYSYDERNLLISQNDPDGTIITYRYDRLGRLSGSTRAANDALQARSANVRYDAFGRIVAELGGEGSQALAALGGGATQAQVDAVWARYATKHTYDNAGRRTSTTDALGYITYFYYDGQSRLSHTLNGEREVVRKTYNAFGEVRSERGFNRRASTTTFAAISGGGLATATLDDKLDSMISSDDRVDNWTYNRRGALASVVDILGGETRYTLNAFGEVEERSQKLNAADNRRIDKYTYDERGLLLTHTADANGASALTQTEYDAFGRAWRSVDANGNATVRLYDRLGRAVAISDPVSGTSTTYDAFARVLRHVDGSGRATAYAYNTALRTMTLTTEEGVSVKTKFTRHGETQSIEDGKQQLTTYEYDRNGDLKLVTTPLTTESNVYDDKGRLKEAIDRRGNKVAYTYDAADRVKTVMVDPGGVELTTSYEYDGRGNTIKVTDPREIVTTIAYDRNSRTLTRTVDSATGGLNLQTVYTYDLAGRTLSVTEPGNKRTEYVYDALGRRTKETVDPGVLDIVTEYEYDDNGNMVMRTDDNGGRSLFAYDVRNRLQYAVDQAGGVTFNQYDGADRLLRATRYAKPIGMGAIGVAPFNNLIAGRIVATPGKDAVDARVYDRDGRLRFTVDGNGSVVRYSYDKNNNVTERMAYAKAITLSAWDGVSAPAVVEDAARDRRTLTAYDALNRVQYVRDSAFGITGYLYDGNGNVIERTQYANASATASQPTASADNRITIYVYDKANRRTWERNAAGAVTQNEYDDTGNVTRIRQFAAIVTGTDPTSVKRESAKDRITDMNYDALGRLIYNNDALGYVTTYKYDDAARTEIKTRHFNKSSSSTGTPSTSIYDQTEKREFDAAGRMWRLTDAYGKSESYTFDGLGNKLTFTNKKGSIWTYAYDAAGRLEMERTPVVDSARVTWWGGIEVEGFQTLPIEIVTWLTYDGLGQLVLRREAAGLDEQRETSYEYDAAGHQIRVRHPEIAVYVNESPAALASNGEYNSLATRSETLKPLTSETFYNAFGEAVANIDTAGNASFKAYDLAGRVRYDVDAMGYVTGYENNAFGEVEALTRYAIVTTLTNTVPTGAAQAPSVSNVAEAIQINNWDRTIRTRYDKMGRVADVTEPAVYVYDADTRSSTYAGKRTHNVYNAFGEVIEVQRLAQILPGNVERWSSTFHYYDRLGRNVATIDPMGHRTSNDYDAVGNLELLTEYATPLTAGTWDIDRLPSATTSNDDRSTRYKYDRLNRRVEEARLNVEYSSGPTAVRARGNVTTVYAYDVLGNLTETLDAQGGRTFIYYDALGRTAAIAAPTRTSTLNGASITPLTTFKRDAHGNIIVQTEYEKGAINAQRYDDVSSEATPGVTGDMSGGQHNSFARYDKHGHVLTTTDAGGISQSFSYNERGDVAKTWQSTQRLRSALGSIYWDTVYQVHRYDKLGRLTQTYTPAPKGEYKAGVTMRIVASRTPEMVAFLTNVVDIAWNSLINPYGGKVKVVMDYRLQPGYAVSQGQEIRELSAADASGGVVISWGPEGGLAPAGISQILRVQVWQESSPGVWVPKWDSLQTPATGADITYRSQAQAGSTETAQEYNAFGEVVRKGINGGFQEYFDYDRAGRLWRTNSGDGIDKIYLYDVLGRVTAKITSSGEWFDDRDLKTLTVEDAASSSTLRRTDTKYDALGRVIEETLPERTELPISVSVFSQASAANIASSAAVDPDYGWWTGTNSVDLYWHPLDQLGSGDIKVVLEYWTRVLPLESIPGGVTPLERQSTSRIFSSDRAVAGARIEWTNDEINLRGAGGISEIASYVVYKKDSAGDWQKVIDPSNLSQSREDIRVTAPSDPATQVQLQYRPVGSPGNTGWTTQFLTAVNFGKVLRYDLSQLPYGNYEYQVITTLHNESAIVATGTVTLSCPPLENINVPITYQLGPGVLTWPSGGMAPTTAQVFNYRLTGNNGAWQALPVQSNGALGVFYVDHSALPSGSYEFELLWSSGDGVNRRFAHALGSFRNIPAVPAHTEIRTITPVDPAPYIVGTTRPTYSAPIVTGYDGSGNAYLAEHYAWSGDRVVAVPYETQVQVGERRTDVPNVSPPGWITPDDPSNYIISHRRAEYSAPIFVGYQADGTPILAPRYFWSGNYVYADQRVGIPGRPLPPPLPDPQQFMTRAPESVYGPPVFVGTDADGKPILGRGYAYESGTSGKVIAVPYFSNGEIVSWDTIITPIYEYVMITPPDPNQYMIDPGGKPIYSVPITTGFWSGPNQNFAYHYDWMTPVPNYVWQDGKAVAVPYQVEYNIPATPPQFAFSVDMAPSGAASMRIPDIVQVTQTKSLDGGTIELHPRVVQKIDRWGNVIEINDPRNADWKTFYRYDWNNHLIEEATATAANGAIATQWYYDKFGQLVANKDANGHVTGYLYDAGGNLIEQRHQENRHISGVGRITHFYDGYGNRVATIDAEGNANASKKSDHTTTFYYDAIGQLLKVGRGPKFWRDDPTLGWIFEQRWEHYEYDLLGQKISYTNAANEKTRYRYDLGGHLIETIQPMGQSSKTLYDANGHKLAEVDGNRIASLTHHDYFGRLRSKTDLGGAEWIYSYDGAGQLTATQSTRHKGGEQVQLFHYDPSGQLVYIYDDENKQTTTYSYDVAGNRVRERTSRGSIVYQDNQNIYDELERLVETRNGSARVRMEYDKVGNRTRVRSNAYVLKGGSLVDEELQFSDRYFNYDSMNRQYRVNVNFVGVMEKESHVLTYDLNGNRTSDAFEGNHVNVTWQRVLIEGDDGSPVWIDRPVAYAQAQGFFVEYYVYDSFNQLTRIERDGLVVERRSYDNAGRLKTIAPDEDLPKAYLDAFNQGLPANQQATAMATTNHYDANGRVASTTTHDEYAHRHVSSVDNRYDDEGNLIGYTQSAPGAYPVFYAYAFKRFDGYKELEIHTGGGRGLIAGWTLHTYDTNGNLIATSDRLDASKNRTLVNDSDGHVLWMEQNGNVVRQLVVNGEVLGRYGRGIGAEFDFTGYRQISSRYPSGGPGNYTVQAGDTLRTIARKAYGDERLWYLIADASNLQGDEDLLVGQTLIIPSRVTSQYNSAQSFAPYDPRNILGSTLPEPGVRPRKNHSNWLAKLVIIVIVAVVTYYLGPYADTVWYLKIVWAAAAAAAGATAGQYAAVGMGLQEKVDWKQVRKAALGGALTAGVGGSLPAWTNVATVDAAINAALTNAATQRISVELGWQKEFSWSSVAIAAVSAGVSEHLKAELAINPTTGQANSEWARSFNNAISNPNLRNAAQGALAGVTTGIFAAAIKGGHFSWTEVATDAFGNALGASLTKQRVGPPRSSNNFDWPDGSSALDPADMAAILARPIDGDPVMDRPAMQRANEFLKSQRDGNLVYRPGVNDPVLRSTSLIGGHFTDKQLVLQPFVGAINGYTGEPITQEDVNRLVAHSQGSDQIKDIDATAAGIRYFTSEPGGSEALLVQESAHSLNKRSVAWNTERGLETLMKDPTNSALAGGVLHLVDDGPPHLGFGGPFGHALNNIFGTNPDFMSPALSTDTFDATMAIVEMRFGISGDTVLPGQVLSIRENALYNVKSTLVMAGLDGATGAQFEHNFNSAARDILPAGALSLPAPMGPSLDMVYRSTPAEALRTTEKYLNTIGLADDPAEFLESQTKAYVTIANTYLEKTGGLLANGRPMAPLTGFLFRSPAQPTPSWNPYFPLMPEPAY